MTLPEFELLDSSSLPPSRGTRGNYRVKSTPRLRIVDFEALSAEEVTSIENAIVHEYVEELEDFETVGTDFNYETVQPSNYRNARRKLVNRPVCFIDGEGANNGERSVTNRKATLHRWVQKQNYALLGAVLQVEDTYEYHHIESPDHVSQLSTKQCLDFIFSIPSSYIIVGFALTYDVEMWLKDVPAYLASKENPEKISQMERL